MELVSIRNINNIAVSFTTGSSTSTSGRGKKRTAKNTAEGKNLLSFKVKYFPVEAGIKTIKVINTKS